MKVSQAVDFHLHYHRANSKKNTIKICEFVLNQFSARFGQRDLASISQEEVLEFLLALTKNNKQATKRNRLMLELMARGVMRVGEVLNLTPADIQGRSLAIQNPKSGPIW